jgi:L-ascorbate metabolism protein UlaG (beta-lactamase superfamily)
VSECDDVSARTGSKEGGTVTAGPRITWWGHSTCMIDDGARILTDPLLTRWLAHLIRRRGEPPDLSHTPPDLVVISHLHFDHFHVASLRLLPRGTRVAVPRGGKALLRQVPVDVHEVDVGDVIAVGSTTVTVLPADHDGRRFVGSRMVAPTLAFLVAGAGTTYFAGDTGLFNGLAEVPSMTKGGPDVALLPVWGWGPTLGRLHLNPATATDALDLVQPSVAIPIHWGTFWPWGMSRVRPHHFHRAGDVFAGHARLAHPQVDVRVLWPGSSTTVSARRALD